MDGPPRSLQCPNCGAQLHPTADAGTITCEFCGAATPIEELIARAQPEPAPAVAPAKRGGGIVALVAVVAVVIAVTTRR